MYDQYSHIPTLMQSWLDIIIFLEKVKVPDFTQIVRNRLRFKIPSYKKKMRRIICFCVITDYTANIIDPIMKITNAMVFFLFSSCH